MHDDRTNRVAATPARSASRSRRSWSHAAPVHDAAERIAPAEGVIGDAR